MKKLIYFLITLVFAVITGASAFVYFYNAPSENIPEGGKLFSVGKGESLYAVSDNLYAEGYIKSPLLLKIISRISGNRQQNKDRAVSDKTGNDNF